MNVVFVLLLTVGFVQGFFVGLTARATVTRQSLSLSALSSSALSRGLGDSSLPLAELFSGPAAKYNGELVMPGLKVVVATKEALPEGARYGDVSSDGLPALGLGLFAVVALAAAVPSFLSIGEAAQSQQRDREVGDKTNPNNSFVNKARSSSGVVVGAKKSTAKSTSAKPAAAPAAAAPKKSGLSFSFGGKPAAKPAAPAAVAPAAAPKKSGLSFSFGGKPAAKPAAPAAAAPAAAPKKSGLSFSFGGKPAAAKPAAPAAAAPKKSSSPFSLKI